MLLRCREALIPNVQIHALEPLVIQLVYLLVDVLGLLQRQLAVVAAGHALDASRIAILLRQVYAISSQSGIVLRLRFQVWLLLVLALVLLLLLLHLVADYLTVQTRQIVALLQTLDVVSGELVVVRVLVAVWMVNIDVCVIIVNHNDPTTVSNMVHVLRSVGLLLLLLLGSLLLGLHVVEVVLIQRLLRHAYLVRADATVVAASCWLLPRPIGGGDVGALLSCALMLV